MNTPRTDAEAKCLYGHVDRRWVSEHFARQLETELNEAKEALKRAFVQGCHSVTQGMGYTWYDGDEELAMKIATEMLDAGTLGLKEGE